MPPKKHIEIANRILAGMFPPEQIQLNPQLIKYLDDIDQQARQGGGSLHDPQAIVLAIEMWQEQNKASQTHDWNDHN